jgi:hypothetical protein
MLQWILTLQLPALFTYVCFCVAVSAFALGSFAKIVQEYLSTTYNYTTEGGMVLGQVAFQWLFMVKESWSERKAYAIIALTVSMVGSLLLLPLIAYHSFLAISSIWATAYFFLVVGVIFVIHRRLVVQKQLPAILTYTWVLYRLLLLVYLVFPR